MNINILVAEKGGGQAPWAPLLDLPLFDMGLKAMRWEWGKGRGEQAGEWNIEAIVLVQKVE